MIREDKKIILDIKSRLKSRLLAPDVFRPHYKTGSTGESILSVCCKIAQENEIEESFSTIFTIMLGLFETEWDVQSRRMKNHQLFRKLFFNERLKHKFDELYNSDEMLLKQHKTVYTHFLNLLKALETTENKRLEYANIRYKYEKSGHRKFRHYFDSISA